MLALARYSMRGAWQAALVTATLLVLAVPFLPLSLLSAAIPALVLLRKGVAQTARTLAIAILGVSAFAWGLFNDPMTLLTMAVVSWLPVLLAASVLRATVSLAFGILVPVVLGALLVLGIFLFHPDPAASGLEVLQLLVPEARVVGETQMGISKADYDAFMQQASHAVTGMMGIGLALNVLLSLFIARWWQAALYNPGGFQVEFHSLRIGQKVATIGLSVLLAAALLQTTLMYSLAAVVVVLFLFQGLAIVHALVKQRRLKWGWLAGLYVFMVFASVQMSLTLATLGVADSWLDFRKRFAGTN